MSIRVDSSFGIIPFLQVLHLLTLKRVNGLERWLLATMFGNVVALKSKAVTL
jgi:hypothetical protein